MDMKDFMKFIPVLQQRDFEIYPQPKGIDRSDRLFTLIDNDQTHLKLQNVSTQQVYFLPVVLVEFANPGILRLYREVTVRNGSFV